MKRRSKQCEGTLASRYRREHPTPDPMFEGLSGSISTCSLSWDSNTCGTTFLCRPAVTGTGFYIHHRLCLLQAHYASASYEDRCKCQYALWLAQYVVLL